MICKTPLECFDGNHRPDCLEHIADTSKSEMSCPGDCEPMCAWCNKQADIAAAGEIFGLDDL